MTGHGRRKGSISERLSIGIHKIAPLSLPMDKNLETAYSEVDRDLSTEWLALTERVRSLTHEIHATSPSEHTALLSGEVTKLCDHVERLHHDVVRLLVELDEKLPEFDLQPTHLESSEIQQETLQIHREAHELRADFKDIIKALFMWQDDPVDRLREKKSS